MSRSRRLMLLLLLCLTTHCTLLVSAFSSPQETSSLCVRRHLRDDDGDNDVDTDGKSATLSFSMINPVYTSLATAETVFWYWFAPGIDPNYRWFAPTDGILISNLLNPTVLLTEPGYAFSSLLLNSFLIVPMVWALLLLQEEEDQLVPPLPFCLAGFLVGGGALIPYMIVRRPKDTVDPYSFSAGLKLFETSVGPALLTLLAAVVLISFAIEISHSTWAIEWEIFVDRLFHSQFTSLALFDFIMISCTIIDPITDDAKRRGYLDHDATTPDALWKLVLYLVPIVGPVAWIFERPKYVR